MSKACEQCGVAMVRKENESASDFAKRKFCGYACANANQRKVVNVLGVSMTIQELMYVLGVSRGCIDARISRGSCLVSGKKNK